MFVLVSVSLWANTPVKSYEEDYYSFLTLTGKTERPWIQNDNALWQNDHYREDDYTPEDAANGVRYKTMNNLHFDLGFSVSF